MAVELVDWGAEEASHFEIGEGHPWRGGGLVGQGIASSCRRGLGVGVWRLVGYR